MLETRKTGGRIGKGAEGMSFLFFMFLLYLFFLFLRPMELFILWLAPLRPMAVIWVIAFFGALFDVIQHRQAAALPRHYWVLAGLSFSVLMSLLWQGRIGDAFNALADFSASVFLFCLISFNLRTLPRLKQACFMIVGCLTALAACGILAYWTGYKSEQLFMAQRLTHLEVEAPDELPSVPASDTSGAFLWRLRSVGVLSDPNDFAQALVMGLPMLVWFARKGAWMRNLFVVGGPAAIILYAIVLTKSRGAYVGLAVLAGLYLRDKLGTVKTMMLMGLAGAAVLGGSMVGGRAMSSKERSAEERIEAWFEGLQMLKSSPLFGVGWGLFSDNYYITAHNSFVLGFAELGLVGYFFWMAMLVMGFKAVWRVAEHAPAGSEEAKAGAILRASLLGYLACAWFLSRTYQSSLFCVLALATAVWMCAARSPACADIKEIKAPLTFLKATIVSVVVSISVVRGFIMMHHL